MDFVPSTGATEPPGQPEKLGLLRLARLAARTSDSYGLLLALLLVDYVLLSLVTGRWIGLIAGVPLSLTLLLAMRTSGAHRRGVRAAQVTVVLVLALGLANGIAAFTAGEAVVTLVLSAVLAATPYVIVRRILAHPTVSAETILGAVCVYILIGLFFAMLYTGIARTLPTIYGTPLPKAHWFLAQPPAVHPPSNYLYLSFVTMTTVGFGDLTPLTNLARSIVVLEALTGQIFLVTLVARLVALYGTTRPPGGPPRLRPRPGDAPPSGTVGTSPAGTSPTSTSPGEPGDETAAPATGSVGGA